MVGADLVGLFLSCCCVRGARCCSYLRVRWNGAVPVLPDALAGVDTFYCGHGNHSDTLSLSLSHSVRWPQLRWCGPTSCHQAAISGASVATCNLGWEHLCLVSLATERREMTGLSTRWLSFHSDTHYLFLQNFGGPQLYGEQNCTAGDRVWITFSTPSLAMALWPSGS